MTELNSGKINWTVLIAVFLAALIFIFYSVREFNEEIFRLAGDDDSSSGAPAEKKRFWIELDFGGDKKRLFELAVEDLEYPLAPALITIAEFGNFTVELKKDGTIAKIDGVNGKWGVYKDGEKINVPAENLLVRAGERVTIKQQP